MNLRQALIEQSPSLALQRAAADEIARQDGEIQYLRASVQGQYRQLLAWQALYLAGLELDEHESQDGDLEHLNCTERDEFHAKTAALRETYRVAKERVQQLCL